MLGTVLYDADAFPKKKQRMIRTAEQATSLTTGIRLTGFQVSRPFFPCSLFCLFLCSTSIHIRPGSYSPTRATARRLVSASQPSLC